MRIAKFIADSGVASRRAAERLIESGAVTVDGVKIDTPVFFVTGGEKITVDGKIISHHASRITRPASRLFAFHKPINTMTTARDPMGRRTIYDILPAEYKNLRYVGRLDFKTTGLLLLTNDGDLARKLTLPSMGIERVYIATVSGTDFSGLSRARRGITVDGIKYRPMVIEEQGHKAQGARQLKVTITEGKKNEVRIVLAAIGLPVLKLHRISYGPIKLGNLPAGEIIEIEQKSIDLMRKSF